ncbi:MAG: sirohydrochlorin cobaltochelatase [Oscillospiraceae bacterium]|nr:sirohydrochlorin cobaltochelatase [Oscillospiraceae bacterium]
MKRSVKALAMVAAALMFTACGSSPSTSEPAPAQTEQTTTVSETSAETTAESDTETTTAAETTEAETSAEQTEDPAGGNTEEPDEVEEDADEEEDYTTGDASLDDPRNQDGIGENELLVVSFGTSYNDSRRLTIGAIESALESAIPDYSVRRGFTANIIIDHVKRRDGEIIDDVDEALKRAVDNGVKNLVVAPTHLMHGFEYDELVEKVASYADAFESVTFSEPLLTSDEDFKRVEEAIVDWTKEYDDGETAIVFMGHGTEHEYNFIYGKMQDLLTADGHEHYYIGTVEATPSLDDVIAKVKEGGYKRVVLEPLMVVAGDHANNDMAGDDDESWKTAFEKEGFEVVCVLRGLGENESIRQIYIDHVKQAVGE